MWVTQNLLVLAVAGRQCYAYAMLRGPPPVDPVPGPPPVNPLLHELAGRSADAKIAAMKAKAVAAAMRTQSAAAQAATSKLQAEKVEMENVMKKPDLDHHKKLAEEAAKKAVVAAKEATGALKQTQEIAKTAIEEAKKMAVAEVAAELTKKYHELDEWRTKVLDSPYERAQKAGMLAAKPYNDMIKQFYMRQGQYQDAAAKMMAKANSLASGAAGLAGGAQGRLNGGDAIGANQDIFTATAMKGTSEKYAGAAQALQGQASQMEKYIAEYVAAGHLAAWTEMYKTDPDALPPPPKDPNVAFTPPPPSL